MAAAGVGLSERAADGFFPALAGYRRLAADRADLVGRIAAVHAAPGLVDNTSGPPTGKPAAAGLAETQPAAGPPAAAGADRRGAAGLAAAPERGITCPAGRDRRLH